MTSSGRSLNLSSRLTTAALAIAVMVGAASLVHCDSSLPRDVNYDSGVGAEFTPPERQPDAAADASLDGVDAGDAQTGGAGGGAGGAGGTAGSGGVPATGGEAALGGAGTAGEAGAAGGEAGADSAGAGGVPSGGAAGG